MKERVVASNHYGLTKGKSYLTRAVGDERSEDAVYIHFYKGFDTVTYMILVSKLGHYSPDEWTTG